MKPPLSLSRHWPIHIRSAMMSVVSLAHAALTHSRSYAVNSPIERVRIAEDRDRFKNETSLLKEELRIKDARMSRIDPKHRPYYTCVERLQILELRAARALSAAQTARMFHVEPVTVRLWMKRVDAQDAKPLIQLPVPVNKFSDYVRYVVQRLKVLCPAAGKIRIAQILARAGLSISPSTVLRILKSKPVQPTPADSSISPAGKDPLPDRHFVTANYPHHLWHVDLTVVPLFAGFWIPWLPFARLQTWPFCWWVACVIDHFSRRVVGFRLFHNQPTARQVRAVLSRAIRKSKRAPKYIVSDKGPQFWCDSFKAWCRRKNIKTRFGAIGKHGSIAIIERFFRSMKSECTRRILVSFHKTEMLRELDLYVRWYNHHRPHQGINGLTPDERALGGGLFPTLLPTPLDGRNATGPPRLVVHYLDNKKHLPIIELKPAA